MKSTEVMKEIKKFSENPYTSDGNKWISPSINSIVVNNEQSINAIAFHSYYGDYIVDVSMRYEEGLAQASYHFSQRGYEDNIDSGCVDLDYFDIKVLLDTVVEEVKKSIIDMGSTFGLKLVKPVPTITELRKRLRRIMESDSVEERDRFFEELEKLDDRKD